MFSALGVQDAINRMEEKFNLAHGGVIEHTIEEVNEWTGRLQDVVDEKGNNRRDCTPEESSFIINELVLTKASFEYWATRYCKINIGGAGLANLYPLLESQQLVVSYLGKLEHETLIGDRRDGLLVNCLKAPRQVGISTLAEAIVAFKATTQGNLLGIIASDVPDEKGSGYLFDMFERIVDNLPWWLKPTVTERVKNSEIKFDTGTNIWVESGKSTRGTTGQRGQIGRGKTNSLIHLSELSTWENAEQIDSALMPSIPYNIRSFALLESTAKGQGNWWHKQWLKSKAGVGRFTNIFIPWYIISKYSVPCPDNWIPKDSTLAIARQVEVSSEKLLHKKITVTREQLHWYERERASFEYDGRLKDFLEEYGAVDDRECFQITGKSIFKIEVTQRIVEQAKPAIAVAEIVHKSELPGLPGHSELEIPAGHGLRVLSHAERRYLDAAEDALNSHLGYLIIWELPRRGKKYVLSADIADGIGKDRSVIEITRVGDLKEPDEQVAQLVSNSIDPIGFAVPIDVIGRFYSDDEGFEALAAIENNNHGLATQSELQNHLGYQNFFVWQYLDSIEPGKQTRAIGWQTTRRTRPLILTRYARKVAFIDPDTGQPDYRINSPFTIAELRTFTTATTIAEAEAAPGGHDDCIMAGAIGIHVAQTMHFEENEDLDTSRRRLAEQFRNQQSLAERQKTRRDFANTDITHEEMTSGLSSLNAELESES